MSSVIAIGGILEGLTNIKTVSNSAELFSVFKITSHILFGMAFGIVLTLRIFGQIKLGNKTKDNQ